MMNENGVMKFTKFVVEAHYDGLKRVPWSTKDPFTQQQSKVMLDRELDKPLMKEYLPKLQAIFKQHLEPKKPHPGEFKENLDLKGAVDVKDAQRIADRFIEGAQFHFPAYGFQNNMIVNLVSAAMAARAEGAVAGLIIKLEEKTPQYEAKRTLDEGKREADKNFRTAVEGLSDAYPGIVDEKMSGKLLDLIEKVRKEEFERGKEAAKELEKRK